MPQKARWPATDDELQRFVRDALDANVDIAVFNVADGAHGFERDATTRPMTAITVEALINFLKRNLSEDHP